MAYKSRSGPTLTEGVEMISVENVGLYQNDIGVMYSNPLRRVDDRGDNPGSRGTKCVTLTLLAMLCSLAYVNFNYLNNGQFFVFR